MTSQQAKITALASVIGLIDVQLRSGDEGDLWAGVVEASQQDKDRFADACEDIIESLTKRLNRLKRTRTVT